MGAARPPELSVIIPTLGRSRHLRPLVERLHHQTADFAFEVLVIANIPQQSLREFVNSFGSNETRRFEYLETGRLGANLARNKGIDRARAPILLFLDDDAILDSDTFLARHVELHRSHKDCAALGGPYRLIEKHSQWDTAYHAIAHDWLQQQVRKNHRTSQLLGGNMSIKKKSLDLNGWKFDEEIAFGGAETGLCQRFALADMPLLFFQDLEIGHAPELTRTLFCRKAYLQGAGASWRERKLGALSFQTTNEFLSRPSNHDGTAKARALYRRCFEFGYHQSPYEHVTANEYHKPLPSFQYSRYLLYRVQNLKPLTFSRRLHRTWYAMLRTAWMNGRIKTPSLKSSSKAN